MCKSLLAEVCGVEAINAWFLFQQGFQLVLKLFCPNGFGLCISVEMFR